MSGASGASGAPYGSVTEAFAAIDAALAFLGSVDHDVAPSAAAGFVQEVVARQRRLEAVAVGAVGALDRHRVWAGDGAPSGAAWLRSNLRFSRGHARSMVATARRLPDLPVMGAALARGRISLAHLQVVSAAMERTPARAASIGQAEPAFAAAATELDPAGLARVVQRWAHTVDPLGVLAAEQAVHAQRFLSVSRTFDGAVVVNGVLAPEPGALVLTALEALATRDYRDNRDNRDERTAGQRRADALAGLCSWFLDSGAAPTIGGVRPHVSLTVPLATLAAPTAILGHAPGELEGAGCLSAPAARRISCDASVTGFTVDAAGMPLSYGRTQRVVPPALRRFLVLRDRGCVMPGCARPPSWTQAHHLVHWSRGGPTAAENLALVCTHDHHLLHEGGYTVAGTPTTGLRFYRPDGTELKAGSDRQRWDDTG